MWRRENFCSYRDSNSDSSAFQPYSVAIPTALPHITEEFACFFSISHDFRTDVFLSCKSWKDILNTSISCMGFNMSRMLLTRRHRKLDVESKGFWRWCITQNYWVFGLFPSSGILENIKHDVSESGEYIYSVGLLR
jgi:hypothetical protein